MNKFRAAALRYGAVTPHLHPYIAVLGQGTLSCTFSGTGRDADATAFTTLLTTARTHAALRPPPVTDEEFRRSCDVMLKPALGPREYEEGDDGAH